MNENLADNPTNRLEQSAEKPIWIVEDEQLRSACQHWLTLSMIAIDTEFMRVDTFYPIPGLIQIADRHACYLIDPLEVTDMSPLVEVLSDSNVIKVIHAASEDLELFRHHYGVVPSPLFDTQVAAAFAGWGFSMGLQRIVEKSLKINLGKGHTRSDWLQRPLSQEQILYAALDVAYLPAIAQQLTSELKQLGRYEWMLDECQFLCLTSRDTDPEGVDYYRRFTQMNSTSPTVLAGLRDLSAWREKTCRERNLCRPLVIKNEAIMAVIDAWPTNLKQLSDLRVLKPQQLKKDGQQILDILKGAEESAERNPPEPIQLPIHVYHSETLKRLKAIGRDIAKKENILPELLARRKDLEKLINSQDDQGHFHLPDTLQGWRKSLLGEPLLAELAKCQTQLNETQETRC